MPIQITSRFVAVGKAQINDEWLPVTITGNRTKFGPEPVKCSVILDLSHKESWINRLSGLSSRLTQFQGQTADGFSVWATDFQQEIVTAYSNMTKWEGIAKQFIESNTGCHPECCVKRTLSNEMLLSREYDAVARLVVAVASLLFV